MVRLGYATCTACHLAPQGAGLLTDYGKGIDVAQSLRVTEYDAPDPARPMPLRYDVRLLTSGDLTTSAPSGAGTTSSSLFRSYFRSSATLGAHNRLASTLLVAAPAAPAGDVARLWQAKPDVDFLGAWEYSRSARFTVAVARDRLPRGVELGETTTILRDGETDRFPSQVRVFVTASRLHVTAYAYGPGSSNAWDRRDHGAGVLGEMQFLDNHLVLGASARRAVDRALDGQIVGGYARIGFGKWGVLAEHEVTHRTITADQRAAPGRFAGYTQLFFVPKEWLVVSLIGEQANDITAAHARTFRWRPEFQARLSSYMTVTGSVRSDTPLGTTGTSRTYLVQLAMKTVK